MTNRTNLARTTQISFSEQKSCWFHGNFAHVPERPSKTANTLGPPSELGDWHVRHHIVKAPVVPTETL